MRFRNLVAIVLVPFLFPPAGALAEIKSSTGFTLDLSKPQEAAKKAEWSDPDKIKVTGEGLGWGGREDKGSRDVWLLTVPIGIGYSWRPTSIASIKATVEGDGFDRLLYARYSADGKCWTTRQQIEAAGKRPGVYRGTLRVQYREAARYHQLRLEYARRID
jgi:hypothetical protein